MKHRTSLKLGGFILLELLLSLAIVGILAVVILESENLALKIKENSSAYTHLILSANDALSQVLDGNDEVEIDVPATCEVVEKMNIAKKIRIKVGNSGGPSIILHTIMESGE